MRKEEDETSPYLTQVRTGYFSQTVTKLFQYFTWSACLLISEAALGKINQIVITLRNFQENRRL